MKDETGKPTNSKMGYGVKLLLSFLLDYLLPDYTQDGISVILFVWSFHH